VILEHVVGKISGILPYPKTENTYYDYAKCNKPNGHNRSFAIICLHILSKGYFFIFYFDPNICIFDEEIMNYLSILVDFTLRRVIRSGLNSIEHSLAKKIAQINLNQMHLIPSIGQDHQGK
jgi:hypothetical protein